MSADMDDPRDRDVLAFYPYVVVRLACARCTRSGAYRLARLAAKYGAEIGLLDLMAKLAFDCPFRRASHPYRGGCKARFVDLDGPPFPPDLPPRSFRVIKGDKADQRSAREMLRDTQVTKRRGMPDR